MVSGSPDATAHGKPVVISVDLPDDRSSAGAFMRSSLSLISGTITSQVIVFLCSPLLSRIFSPSDFGNLANFNAWVSILALLSTLRYEHAVIVTKGRLSRNRVLALATSLIIASVALDTAAAALIYAFPASAGYLRELRGIVLFIPLGVLVGSIASLLNLLNARVGNFNSLAVLGVVQVAGTVVLQLALGLRHVRHALVLGALGGSALSCVAFVALFMRSNRIRHVHREMTPDQLRRTATKHVNFPRYTLAADAINVVLQQFVPVFLLAMFDPVVAGLYAFSVRAVRVPMFVISAAVSTVLRKHAGDELQRHGSVQRLFRTTVISLSLLALVPVAILLFFGRPLFAFVFGQQWSAAGSVVQILSPGIMLEFVAAPLTVFFLITNSQRYTFRTQLAGLVLLLAALLVGRTVFHNFLATCGLISATMLIVNLTTVILAFRVVRVAVPGRIAPA